MAVSGSQNFSQTRNEVINDALGLLQIVYAGESANAASLDYCNRMLNSMIKSWNAKGYRIWTLGEATLVFAKDTAAYTIGQITGTDKAFKTSGLISTTISADEAAAQTTLSVTSSAGMATNDVCFIELDDGSMHVTTISSVPNASSIIVNDALAYASASGSAVFTYTAATDVLPSIREIEDVRIRYFSDNTDRRLIKLDRKQYYGIVDKAIAGDPTSYFVEETSADPIIYFWPVPEDLSVTAKITYSKSLDDMDSSSDDFDFPTEWLHCLKYNLAVQVAPYFGKESKLKVLSPLAQMYLRDAIGFSSPDTSMYFQPKRRG